MNKYPSPLPSHTFPPSAHFSDEERFTLTMDVYFAFRLAFVDLPEVRLRTQEGQRPDLIQVVLSEWYWDPPLEDPPMTAEEFYFNESHSSFVYVSGTTPPMEMRLSSPRQWTGACELDIHQCTTFPPFITISAAHFRGHYDQKKYGTPQMQRSR